jgi:hypothetical protein
MNRRYLSHYTLLNNYHLTVLYDDFMLSNVDAKFIDSLNINQIGKAAIFPRVTPIILNTLGIEKHKLLIALFNNAKRSKWTEATVGNSVCPDPFVRSLPIFLTAYKSQIAESIDNLNLTE